MNFPNPTDAISNPVRYWTDVTMMQIEMGRQVYAIAASMNPYLPKDGFVIGAAEVPVPVRKVRRSAPRRTARAPVAKVTKIAQAKPAPKVAEKTAEKATPKSDAPAPKRARRPARKSVSLTPDLPPSKPAGKT